jgi:hypothetical protein
VAGSRYAELEKLQELRSRFGLALVKNPELADVANALAKNVLGLLDLAALPKQVFFKGFHYYDLTQNTPKSIRLWTENALDTLKRESENNVDSEKVKAVEQQARQAFNEVEQRYRNLGPDMSGNYEPIEQAFDDSYPNEAIALMSSLITGAWATFEVLAGDLWEACLNANPAGLAELTGERKRIIKRAGTRLEKSERNQGPSDRETGQTEGMSVRLIDVQILTRGTYNLSSKMGSLLRGYFKFTTLTGIREAYARAFKDHPEAIDSALEDKGLGALWLVRNLIVHKTGIVDQGYLDDAKTVPRAPRPALGQSLEIDGQMTRDLIEPVVTCCTNLVMAIDSDLSRRRTHA